MTKGIWIGQSNDTFQLGEVGFLVRLTNSIKGWDYYQLRPRPATANYSFQPRLHGWCGTTNDTSVYADGMAMVSRVLPNGRAFVIPLEGGALQEALESMGFPELGDAA